MIIADGWCYFTLRQAIDVLVVKIMGDEYIPTSQCTPEAWTADRNWAAFISDPHHPDNKYYQSDAELGKPMDLIKYRRPLTLMTSEQLYGNGGETNHF